MEDWGAHCGHQGYLLGGTGYRGWHYQGGPGGRWPALFEDSGGGKPSGEPGQVGWAEPHEVPGGACVPPRLSKDGQRGASSWEPVQAAHRRQQRGLDGEPYRDEETWCGGGGRAPEGPREGRRAKRRQTRGRSEAPRGRRRRGDQFRVRGSREEKEEEKEEEIRERQGEDLRNQGVGECVRGNCPGSQAGGEENDPQESQACSKEKRKEAGLDFLRVSRELQRQWEFPWRRSSTLRGGSSSKDGMETLPGGVDPQHSGVHPGGCGQSDWAAVAAGSIQPTSNLLPILETGLAEQDGRCHEQRSTNALLCPGSFDPRAGGGSMRCVDPEIKGSGTSACRQPLPGQPEAGACTSGHRDDDVAHGSPGSSKATEGGAAVPDSSSQTLGAQSRVGKETRGEQGQRQDQGYKRQRQDKGRSSRAARGEREREEVKLKRSWELADSEKVSEGREFLRQEVEAEGFGAVRVPGPAAIYSGATMEPGPTGLGAVDAGFTTGGMSYGELAEIMLAKFVEFEVSLGLRCSKDKTSGGIFPLPETRQGLYELLGQFSTIDPRVLVGMCVALNSYAGAARVDGCQRSLAAQAALRTLSGYALTSGLSSEKLEGLSWAQFLAVRSVDYRGEEVRVAKRFTWANIEPALPDGVGSIPLSEVCEGGVLDFVNDFERYLLPLESRVYTKPPRIFVEPESWEQVCSGLLSKGVCRLIPLSEVYHFSEGPLLNGLFSVSKDEFTPDGVEVCRLIMNLVPTNKLCRNLGGDISTLPSVTGLSSVVLGEEDVLVMSSEDIRCFFYLFSVPPGWHKFMTFAREVPTSVAPAGAQEPYYLAARVLPMGFISSVAIAQHIHRRLARLYLHGIGPTHGGQCELRRDKPGSSAAWLYRVYLDNFDALERCDRKLASLIKGEPSVEALALRQGYTEFGLPRHPKKSVQQETVAEIQGAVVNGVTGMVEPKVQKVLKYVDLAWQLLQSGKASQKQLQVVCGGFVYCCMFRRPLLGMLNQVWKFIMSFENEPPVVKKPLPGLVQYEMLRFMLAMPLAQMNLRTPVRGEVTCSDASEWGGGFCVSKGLTPMGVHAAGCHVRGDLPEIEDHIQVLTIGLFDGIGALRVGADVLKLPMAGHVSSEVSKEGCRVLESNFPDSEQVGDVNNIDDDMVLSWAVRYSNVGLVVVGGGPPCQGVSGLNADRKGALKDARSSLFVHVKRVYELCKVHFKWAQVQYMMESVFSMDAQDRATMSAHMGVQPYLVDAADIAICRRPRLYWLSWEIQESPVVTLVPHGEGVEQYFEVKLDFQVDKAQYLQTGWTLDADVLLPTFTTSRPRSSPGNRPAGLWQCEPWERDRWVADKHRYPPYVYRDKHLLVNQQGERRLPREGSGHGFPCGVHWSVCP